MIFLSIFNKPIIERQTLAKATDSYVTVTCSDRTKLLRAEKWTNMYDKTKCCFLNILRTSLKIGN